MAVREMDWPKPRNDYCGDTMAPFVDTCWAPSETRISPTNFFRSCALKFIAGDFRNADPSRGKFRSFVKTVLFRMVAQHYRKQGRRKEVSIGDPVLDNLSGANEPVACSPELDELFLVSWRDEVLLQTWEALADYEGQGGGPYHTVLKTRVENPALDSEGLAEAIARETGKPTSAGSARVLVHRAREKFAQLLINQIACSLAEADDEAIEQELVDLRLIDYCRDAISSRNQQNRV